MLFRSDLLLGDLLARRAALTRAVQHTKGPAPRDPDREADIAGLSVRCRPTDHSVPTVALRLSCGGRTLGWSSDTPFDPDLIQWLQEGANLVVHETSPPPTHTPIEPLNDLPASVRQRIRLIHMPDGFDQTSTDMRCLRQGEVVQV